MTQKQSKTITGKNSEELKKLLQEAQAKLFTLRLDNTRKKLKNTRSLFLTKKEIARILSKLKEMEMKQTYA